MSGQNTEKRLIYRLPPCPAHDLEGTESWLGDMAARGLLLAKDGFFAGLAAFEQAEPQKLRFRLEAAPRKSNILQDEERPAEDVLELSADYGWTYLGMRGQFFIFCAPEDGGRELNTDPRVQALTLRAVRSQERRSWVMTLIWLLIYPLLRLRGSVILTAVHVGTPFVLFGLLLIFWALCRSAGRVIHLRRLGKRLAAGLPPDHRKDWRQGAGRYWAGKILFVLGVLLWAGIFLHTLSYRMMDKHLIALEDYDEPLPFPTIRDLAEGSYRRTEFDFTNHLERTSDWLAPLVIEYRETGSVSLPDGRALQGGLSVSYYEAASPALARIIARERFRQDRWDRDYSPLEPPGVEADFVAAYTRVFPILLMQKENVVIRVQFYQTSPNLTLTMEEWALPFAAALPE